MTEYARWHPDLTNELDSDSVLGNETAVSIC